MTIQSYVIGATVLFVVIGIAIALYFIFKPSLPTGSLCKSNSDCAAGACGRNSAGNDAPTVCCASGSIVHNFGYDYCTQLPNGTSCYVDAMCSGGICSGNGLGTGTSVGTCTGNIPSGQPCANDKDCANQSCGRESYGNNASLVCCKTPGTTFFGDYYCTDFPPGAACRRDTMCASGHCANDITSAGTCS